MKPKETPAEKRTEVSARSETGYVRDENQDRMSSYRVPHGQLYIVADGMGGHKGGAKAAELTIQGLYERFSQAAADTPVEAVIKSAFAEANKVVYEQAHAGDPATAGMGSTAVLVLINGSLARIAHVGDSRAYRYRRGELEQLTTDHTVVQKMVDAQMITPEQALDHPNAGMLDRAVGIAPGVEVEIRPQFTLEDGDGVLLCSDGLCGYVDDAAIEAVLRSDVPVQNVPKALVNLALQAGGEDNVTVQYIQYGQRTKYLPPERKWQRFLDPVTAGFILGAALTLVAAGAYFWWTRLPVVALLDLDEAENGSIYRSLEALEKSPKKKDLRFTLRPRKSGEWQEIERLVDSGGIYYCEETDRLVQFANRLKDEIELQLIPYGRAASGLHEAAKREFGARHILIVVQAVEADPDQPAEQPGADGDGPPPSEPGTVVEPEVSATDANPEPAPRTENENTTSNGETDALPTEASDEADPTSGDEKAPPVESSNGNGASSMTNDPKGTDDAEGDAGTGGTQ